VSVAEARARARATASGLQAIRGLARRCKALLGVAGRVAVLTGLTGLTGRSWACSRAGNADRQRCSIARGHWQLLVVTVARGDGHLQLPLRRWPAKC
jgi:hypothetical protein